MKKTAKSKYGLHAIGEKIRNKIENVNLPARSSVFFTLTNLLCKGAAFLFTPIFTRLLSPADYGEYSLFSTFLSLSAVVVTMEISGGIIMRLFQKEREHRFLSMLSAWLISVVMAIPITVTLWLIHRISGFGMSFPAAYLFLFLALISISLINLYVSHCKFLYSWTTPFITSIMQSVAAPILSIALLKISYFSESNHVSLKIGAVTAVLLLTASVLLGVTLKNAHAESKTEHTGLSARRFILSSARFLLKLALPLLPYYLSIMVISQVDKLFISSLLGKSELAKYSVAYSAGVALTAVTSGIMGALSPWIMRRTRAGEYDRVRETLDRIISASVPVIILFLCFAPEFFSFLAPSEYQTALPVLFISAMIPIPLALAQCSSSIAIAKEKVGGVLFSGVFPALLTVALDFLIIRQAPLYSAAIITASGFLLLAALGIANVRKITGNYTINVNKAFQNLIFLTIFSAAVYSFRSSLSARLIIAVTAFLSLIFSAKHIVSLLKEKESCAG